MDADTGEIMASGTVVMVTFDYKELKSIPVPDEWKKKISEFEGLASVSKFERSNLQTFGENNVPAKN